MLKVQLLHGLPFHTRFSDDRHRKLNTHTGNRQRFSFVQRFTSASDGAFFVAGDMMLVITTDEPVDIIEELLKHVCGTCGHARTDGNLRSDKCSRSEGYGFKHVKDKGCGAWTDKVI